MTNHTNPQNKTNKYSQKDSKAYFEAQKQVFKNYLSKHTATATMVSIATGIPQKNITRFKTMLEDIGQLKVLFIGECKHTKRRGVQYLTTSLDLIKSVDKGGPL